MAYHGGGIGCAYTAKRQPVALVYHEQHQTREAARQREKQLKRWTRAKKDALISGNLTLLKRL